MIEASKSPLFMGIDQSFTSCGVVIVNDEGIIIQSKIIKTSKESTDFKRSWDIFKEIFELVHKFAIKHIAIEGLAFGKFGNATRSLAILQGVLGTNLLYLRNLDTLNNSVENVEIVTPSCLKKFATGNGKATKKDMIDKVPEDALKVWKEQWKTKPIEDLADAYFLAMYLRQLKLHNLS